jgi:hypothetical protein
MLEKAYRRRLRLLFTIVNFFIFVITIVVIFVPFGLIIDRRLLFVTDVAD